jgi:hypothetical protein
VRVQKAGFKRRRIGKVAEDLAAGFVSSLS